MSSDAIGRRLSQTEQLRKLSLSLMKAKPISETDAAKLREKIKRAPADRDGSFDDPEKDPSRRS